jgi:hypothetical protein
MGFAELFATVASYEFAYFAAPRSAQSLFMSLHFCSAGISSFIGTAYIYGFPHPDVEINFSVRIKIEGFVFLILYSTNCLVFSKICRM